MRPVRCCGRRSMRGWKGPSIAVAECGRELGGGSSGTIYWNRTGRLAPGIGPAGPAPFRTSALRSALPTAPWDFDSTVRISASSQLALAAPVPELADESRGHCVEPVFSSDLIHGCGELS